MVEVRAGRKAQLCKELRQAIVLPDGVDPQCLLPVGQNCRSTPRPFNSSLALFKRLCSSRSCRTSSRKFALGLLLLSRWRGLVCVFHGSECLMSRNMVLTVAQGWSTHAQFVGHNLRTVLPSAKDPGLPLASKSRNTFVGLHCQRQLFLSQVVPLESRHSTPHGRDSPMPS